jgi:hypothetical protein
MKHLITIALLCLFTSAFSQVRTIDNNSFVSLTFGSKPSGNDPCGWSRGICSMTSEKPKISSNAKILVNEDQTLSIYIDRNKITTEDEIKITGLLINRDTDLEKMTFVMQEDFIINKSILQSIKLPENLSIIPTGEYPIIVTEKEFIITLKLI